MVNMAIIITLARGNGPLLRILCFHRRAVKWLYCNKIAGENDSKPLFFFTLHVIVLLSQDWMECKSTR